MTFSLESIYLKVYVPFSNLVSSITIELPSDISPILSVDTAGYSGVGGTAPPRAAAIIR